MPTRLRGWYGTGCVPCAMCRVSRVMARPVACCKTKSPLQPLLFFFFFFFFLLLLSSSSFLSFPLFAVALRLHSLPLLLSQAQGQVFEEERQERQGAKCKGNQKRKKGTIPRLACACVRLLLLHTQRHTYACTSFLIPLLLSAPTSTHTHSHTHTHTLSLVGVLALTQDLKAEKELSKELMATETEVLSLAA